MTWSECKEGETQGETGRDNILKSKLPELGELGTKTERKRGTRLPCGPCKVESQHLLRQKITLIIREVQVGG